MKLKQLFERHNQNDIVEFLEDCRPYIERCMEVSGNNNRRLLFHGTNTLAPGLRRVPFKLRNAGRDTPRHVFDALNEATADMFGGLEPRRWLFVSSDFYVSKRYGEKTAIVFPTGNDFQWFKIKGVMDLYADLESDTHEAWKQWGRDKYVEDELDDEIEAAKEFARQYAYDYLDHKFSQSDFVLNTNFEMLFRGDDEIMIFGDTFYTATPDTLKDILEDSDDMGLTTYQQKMVDWLKKELRNV